MEAGPATLATIPPTLAIYFEVMNLFLQRRVYKNANDTIRQFISHAENDSLSLYEGELMRIVAKFSLGMFAVYSFRPTVVSVASTSLALIYEIHGNGSFYASAGLVVMLLIIMPVFSGIESLDFTEAEEEFSNMSRSGRVQRASRPGRFGIRVRVRTLISASIVILNLALIILCVAVYRATGSSAA